MKYSASSQITSTQYLPNNWMLVQTNQRDYSSDDSILCTICHRPSRSMTKCCPVKCLTSDWPVIRLHSCSTTLRVSAVWTLLISSKTRGGAISLGLGTQVYPRSCSRQNTSVEYQAQGWTGTNTRAPVRFLPPFLTVCKSVVGQFRMRHLYLSLNTEHNRVSLFVSAFWFSTGHTNLVM